MKKLFFILLSLIFIGASNRLSSPRSQAKYDGPVSRILVGYGSHGPHLVTTETFPHPMRPGVNVEVYHPPISLRERPVIFFCHGYKAPNSIPYQELLENLCSNGYVVVFSPFDSSPLVSNETRYKQLWSGFKAATVKFPDLIDTDRVGIVGHSFGGGASVGIGWQAFEGEKWGKDGRFIYAMAPWFSLEITQEMLENYPPGTKMIQQVFDRDTVNDHRMAIDIFENINIPDSEKDFITVYSDVLDRYLYHANHALPTSDGPNGKYDAHDFYGVFRLIQALADYTFEGSRIGKNVALGNGSHAQIDMGRLGLEEVRKLEVDDDPSPKHLQSFYKRPCSHPDNPRRAYCR